MNYKRLFIENGSIFITIVTNNRTPILIENIKFLIKSYRNVSKIYEFKLVAYSVQKDHIHCIIKPKDIEQYPKIIKSFKYSVTKSVGLVNSTQGKIWQNRYWEHTLRDEKDFIKHVDYIYYNPVKHGLVQNVKDWMYSSFHGYVKCGFYDENWGSMDDIRDILDLNYK